MHKVSKKQCKYKIGFFENDTVELISINSFVGAFFLGSMPIFESRVHALNGAHLVRQCAFTFARMGYFGGKWDPSLNLD